MKILIKNSKMILKDKIVTGQNLVIENGVIKNLLLEIDETEKFDIIIDANNDYVSPGFIDIHNHGNSGYDIMDGTVEGLEAMAKYHLSNGVTSFLGATMTNPASKIRNALKNVARYMKDQSSFRSELLGVYLEGPYFNAEKKGAQPLEDIKKPDLEEVKDFIDVSENNIKVVALAPEEEGALPMIEYLVNNDIKVAMGHSNATYDEANKGIDKGVTISTHLYNGMRAFSHREPGIIGACFTSDKVFSEMIVDGIHLHPGAIKTAYLAKTAKKLILISDAMRATGLPDGKSELGGQVVNIHNGEARLEDGTLAGSTLNLRKAVQNMVELCKLPLVDAVRMATYNPASAINMEEKIGQIKEGLKADIIIFDDSINIKNIIKNGHIIK
ncbi:MAG: N-acetylglucosamine-6-phosphate deacetylase [Candidatus Izemoplasmatales bacterium]